MSNKVVETRKLTKIFLDFWGRKKKTALRALDIHVEEGEIFGLLGPNGSGKTTTIKLLLGLLYPTEGEALVLGKPTTDVRKNEYIGYLPEESYLYRFLTAEETLDFYGRLFDIEPAERRRRAAELIERVGLQRDRKRQLREYSKGRTCARCGRTCATAARTAGSAMHFGCRRLEAPEGHRCPAQGRCERSGPRPAHRSCPGPHQQPQARHSG